MFIDKWRDTEIVVYMCNRILLNYKKNAFESVLIRWMNLEPIIQSGASQKETHIVITACVWNLERWYWWTYVQGSNGDVDIKNRLKDTVGEEEGGTNWDNNMETYITICKVDSKWEFAVCHRELNPTLEGMGWERGLGRRGHIYICGRFMFMYGRGQHNIGKQLSSKGKKEK